MISLDLLTSATNNSAGAYGGQSEPQSNGWLLELERAWLNSERGRNGASQAGANSRAESSADAGEESSDRKAGEAMYEDSSLDAAVPSAGPVFSGAAVSTLSPLFDSGVPAAFASLWQALEVSPPASQPAMDGKMAGVSAGTSPTGSGRPGAQEQSSLGVAEDGSSEAPQMPAEGDATYPEKRLHLLEDEHGVRVWIRDAELSEVRGYAVANALRNELGAAGLRLVAVAVNGKEITGNGDPSPESGTALDQDTGYVRSMIDESNLSIEVLSQKEHS